ncbi:MAG: DNA repair protein RadA, partial [Acidobacteria bacterium]|nr:DNA repair protein RadA [Acidobacteriota bacterium]
MTKPRTSYICQSCGYAVSKWMGKCPDCGAWNSIAEEPVRSSGSSDRPGAGISGSSAATAFHEVSSQEHVRFSSGLLEFDRVLGGGIVPGSL